MRILVTGSTTGLGLAAARQLHEEGHEVIVHARNDDRARSIGTLAHHAAVVIGDLSDMVSTISVAEQAKALGDLDGIIHNAAIYSGRPRAEILAVNVIAPYVLTACTSRPERLIFLSSDMHLSGDPSEQAFDWAGTGTRGTQAYCDSKLYVTALALALARRWNQSFVNAVDPGWVPTCMGGAGAPDDLELGHRTQTWLATSQEAEARTSGGYWHHQTRGRAAAAAYDTRFQDALLTDLQRLTGIDLPS